MTFLRVLRNMPVEMTSKNSKTRMPPKQSPNRRRRDDAAQRQADEEHKRDANSILKSSDVTGLKYFAMLSPLLERLHDDASQRDKAQQRTLHYDQYCMLVLLYLFNPAITSLRAIEQASLLAKVRKKLGCSRASLASLSDASRVFDPERLKEIIAELGAKVHPVGRDQRLSGITQQITLVDGSLVSALPSIMDASLLMSQSGSGLVKWRLHTHFEVDRYVPTRIDVTGNNGGQDDEKAVLERTLESDRLYVMDRGYVKYALFNDIVTKKSSYICRVRDGSVYDVVQDHALTEADIAAGVLSDQTISLGGTSKTRPDHAVRLICIKCSPHASRGRRQGRSFSSPAPSSDGILRIVTNLLDVPAEIIALIYSQRWKIEIFFRFFKQFLGCSHLISHSANGVSHSTLTASICRTQILGFVIHKSSFARMYRDKT